MKHLLFAILLFAAVRVDAQEYVRFINDGHQTGCVFQNDSGRVLRKIEPVYDFLEVEVEVNLAGVRSVFYHDPRYCCDTEYIEVPIDPKDFTITRVDTIINDTKMIVPGKLIIAKKNGSWGLLYQDGRIALPFNYDSIEICDSHFGYEYGYFICLIKNKRVSIISQHLERILSEELFKQYYPNLSLKEQLDVLKIAFYGHQLVVNQGGKFIDTTIHVKAKTSLVKIPGSNQKKEVTEPASDHQEYFFRGGKFNVLNTHSGKLQFATWQNKLALEFSSNITYKIPFVMDPGDRISVSKAFEKQYAMRNEYVRLNFIPLDPNSK